MKIIILDYKSYINHQNFNKIHISALLKKGYELTLVGRPKQFIEFASQKNVKIVEMPSALPFLSKESHIQDIIALAWIRINFRLSKYDIVIIPTYDIVATFLFRTSKPTILINHNNVDRLSGSYTGAIKLALTRMMPKNYIHVCLDQETEERMKVLLPTKSVFHVPHGVCTPSKNLSKPSFISEGERFVVIPINSNYDKDTLADLLQSKILHNYLIEQNIVLYIKKQLPYNGFCSNIRLIDSTLEKTQYDYLIENAKAVILPYGRNFKYRCSGIFFECVARNTPVIASDINAFRIYENDSYIRYFKDVYTLINSIGDIIAPTSVAILNNLEIYNPIPYWNKVFDSI